MPPRLPGHLSSRAVDAPLTLGGGGSRVPKRRSRSRSAGTPGPAGARRRILIVEDNADVAETLRDYLELSGHEVCLASTGPGGIEAALRFLPEVVLCDIGLPGLDGWKVAAAIRAEPAIAGARLIAISGYGTDEDRRRSAEAGFETHLTKPLDLDRLDALLLKAGG